GEAAARGRAGRGARAPARADRPPDRRQDAGGGRGRDRRRARRRHAARKRPRRIAGARRVVKLENSFDVDAPPEAAWELLMDVPRVIPCMPGAKLLDTVD